MSHSKWKNGPNWLPLLMRPFGQLFHFQYDTKPIHTALHFFIRLFLVDYIPRENDDLVEKSLCRVAEHLKVHAIDLVESVHLLLADFGKVTFSSVVLPLDLENMAVFKLSDSREECPSCFQKRTALNHFHTTIYYCFKKAPP